MPGFFIQVTQDAIDPDAKDRFAGANWNVGASNEIETARKYRWIFESLSSNIAPQSPLGTLTDGLLIYAHKCGRPTYETEEFTVHHGQSEIVRPGKVKWNPIEIAFYEKVKSTSVENGVNVGYNEAAYRIYSWWRLMIDTSTNYTYPSSNYTKDAIIKQLDGTGNNIYSFNLYNCWPQKVSPADLDYTNTQISEIVVTLRYDKAEEYPAVKPGI